MAFRPPRRLRNPFDHSSPGFDEGSCEDLAPWFYQQGNRMYSPPYGPRICSQIPLGLPHYSSPQNTPKPLTQTIWWIKDPVSKAVKFPWCNFFVKERKHLHYSSHRIPESLNRNIFRDSTQRLQAGRAYHLWGTLVMINFLAYLYQLWAAEPHKGAIKPILLGDMSLYGGGKTSAHVSHTAGTEVDLYYLRTDSTNKRYQWVPGQKNLQFDYAANAALLRVIYKAGQRFAKSVHPDLSKQYQKTLGGQMGKFGLRYVYTDVERILNDTNFKAERKANRLRPSNPKHGSPKHLDHFHVTIT